MLSLTDNAKTAITDITTESGLPAGGGIRLSLTGDEEQVEMALSPQPEADDEVIEEAGARVFVAQTASRALAAHILDAQEGPDGVGFALLRQAS